MTKKNDDKAVKNKPSAKMSLREKKIQDIRKNLLMQRKELLVGAMEALNEYCPGRRYSPILATRLPPR